MINFFKSLQVDFAVFFDGAVYVVQRLVSFLLAVGVILFAFAQMFFIVYRQEETFVRWITATIVVNFPPVVSNHRS
jgi:uncharacterized membrane protein